MISDDKNNDICVCVMRCDVTLLGDIRNLIDGKNVFRFVSVKISYLNDGDKQKKKKNDETKI